MRIKTGPGHKGATAKGTRDVGKEIDDNQLQLSHLYRKIYF